MKVDILGGNSDESTLQKTLDQVQPQIQQMFQLSDRLEKATTPDSQRAVLGDLVKFIEGNGGNKMAIYPYLAQKGYAPDVLTSVGIDPKDIETVANNIKAQTPVTQADMDKLSTSQQEQVQNLQAVIAQLQEQIRALMEEQQRMLAQLAADRDGMAAGPNTRPTEGLAPTQNAPAPSGTVTAAQLASQLNIPTRV